MMGTVITPGHICSVAPVTACITSARIGDAGPIATSPCTVTDTAVSAKTALVVVVILLYGTLVLAEKRSGHVIMLIVGLLAAGMPVIHMRGARYTEIAASSGGFFFVWTLWALGAIGGFTFVLAARGLWNLIKWRNKEPGASR